jgi:c-di-GMP-binding flagellar brake protein YcgR
MKRAFDAGVEFFLFKPVERNKLLKLIRVAEGAIERERRRYTRVPLQCAVSLASDGKQLEGKTVDVSFNGMLIQSYTVFPTGTHVIASLELQKGARPLRFEARVIRTVGTDRIALQFTNPQAEESKRLQEFLLPLILAQID